MDDDDRMAIDQLWLSATFLATEVCADPLRHSFNVRTTMWAIVTELATLRERRGLPFDRVLSGILNDGFPVIFPIDADCYGWTTTAAQDVIDNGIDCSDVHASPAAKE